MLCLLDEAMSDPTKQRHSHRKLSNSTKSTLKIKSAGATIKHHDRFTSPTPMNTISALEITSNPIQLATRSLSSQSLTTNTSLALQSINNLLPSQNSSRSSSLPPSRRKLKSSVSSRRNVETGKKKVVSKSPDASTKRGFNIADHLRASTGNDFSSSGSLSPDVHRLLQDISTVMRSVSPMLEPSQSPPEASAATAQRSASTKKSKNRRLRSKVAANFSLGDGKSKDRVTLHNQDLEGKTPVADHVSGVSSTRSQPRIPPLYLRSDRRTSAAIKIQRWYRGNRNHPSAYLQDPVNKSRGSHVRQDFLSKQEQHFKDVKSLLREKRIDLNCSRLEELERAQSEVEALERKKLEREQRRASKMKADRKAAIEELHKRREEKRAKQETIIKEEIGLLQASGKVKKPQAKRSVRKVDGEKTDLGSSNRRKKEGDEKTTLSKESGDKVVDDFFKAGNIKKSSAAGISLSPSINRTTSTYDEIMDTLRLLEEVPPAMDPPITKGKTNTRGSGGLSEGKLQSILSYLDQVEKAEVDRSNELASAQSQDKSSLSLRHSLPQHKDKTEQKAEMEEVAAAANDVTATILAQRMELDSKAKTVEMLQKALAQQRDLTVYHAKEIGKEGQKRMELQKKEYESTIQRHQCFIDQLIDDKKVLGERCEKLVKELRELERKYKSKLSSLEGNHKVELNKLKQISLAADKLRREKWQSEETHRIKEATVKGLEPEIQRIIAKGKAELQKQKALHEAELMQVDERASRRFVAQTEEMREQCAIEKEQACAHEREFARQRYEKLAEQEELNYQQQRRRLFGEVAQEKEKLAEQLQRQKITLDLQLKENKEINDRLVEELRVGHQQQLEELQLRHRSEARSVNERLIAERQAWEESLMKKQEAEMMAKERALRSQLREERDKEIEMVISRLEEETASSKEETERAAEARIRRIREKYEAELREVERSERSTMEKSNAMKTQLMELKGELTCLQSLLNQRNQEVVRIGEVASKLTQERDNVSDIVRQEFADRLISTEEENKELKIEMSELRARHKVELERVNRAKARELEEVHSRVKQALEKKEENLSALKEQYEGALKRADHLQMLLQRQRTELLKK